MDQPGKQALQQLLAQPLLLRNLGLRLCELPVLNMAALTALEELSVGFLYSTRMPDGLVLPAHLQRLWLPTCSAPSSLQVVTGLQQLQSSTLTVSFTEAEPLLRLKQLPALHHLALRVTGPRAVLGTASAWPLLPQLQELCVTDSIHFGTSEEQWGIVIACVAACTGLTTLELSCCILEEDAFDEQVPVAMCASLAGLTRLKELCIGEGAQLLPGDLLALTALTGLTRLVMNDFNAGMSDLAANALACNLRQLQHLELRDGNLGDMVCLAAIAQLTQLTELNLSDNAGLTEQGLMLLTTLKHLQGLDVSNTSITDEMLRRFSDALRQQQH
jgi:hypothetical protein